MSASTPILNEIRARLDSVRAKQNRVDLHSGTFSFLTLLLLLAASLTLAELTFGFSSAVRTVLTLTFVAVLLLLLGWFLVRPLLRRAGIIADKSDVQLAALVGSFFPAIADRLLNLLQLHQEAVSGKSLYSPELIDASFQDLAEAIQTTPFDRAVDHSVVTYARKNFFLIAGSVLMLTIVFPSRLYDATLRLVYFDREFVQPPEYSFEVWPGNKEVVKGEDVPISVRISSTTLSLPALRSLPVQLRWQREGQERLETLLIRPDSLGIYHATLTGLRTTTDYFVRLDDVESDRYRLTVVDRPVIRSLRVRLDFPPYTKLPPRLQDEFVGDVSALPGTRVTITGTASKTLKESKLVFNGNSTHAMTTRGERFKTTFTLRSESSYSLELRDNEGLTNTNPIAYQLKLIPDEPPTVAILFPGRNIDLAGDKSLPLLIRISDDFGFSRLRLGYRLAHSRYEEISPIHKFVTIQLPADQSARADVRHVWDLSPLKLVPEDIVEYFVEVFDNDVVNGPKSARSEYYLLRLPSLEEVFTDLNKGQDQSIDEMKQAIEEAKNLKEKLEAINQDLKKNKEFDWQQQKKVQEMAKKYSELQKKLENVQAKVDELVDKMQQHNILSPETLEKYLELQQLMSELNSAELQQLLKQMQQAMQNVDKHQLQQVLQQMTFSEERFRQSIERTMNLLKRIQIEQKLDELKKRTEEIRQTQKELEQQAAETSADQKRQSELAEQQSDLARKLTELEQRAAELEKRMEEFFAEMPFEKLRELNEAMRKQRVREQMQRAAEHMREGEQQQAKQFQQQIGEHLQHYGDQLNALQMEMMQQHSQYVTNELRKAINNLLELSRREEALKQQSQDAPQHSPQLRQNAQEQMRVMQDLQSVIQSLSELSQRSFAVTPAMGRAIGEALARMQNAMRGLDVRNGTMAAQEQNAAMAALNRAATQVQQSLQAMMQAYGAGGGLMQQLQMMAGQQMGINMQTQQLGEGMSQERAAQAARLALEQEALRKSLEQLHREAQASQEGERILGDLERIAEEMKEIVANLEQNDVNPETLRKQERILSRLLDASRSMRERDFEKRRKAETGTRIARRSPGELDPATLEGSNRYRDDLLRAIEQGFAKDYQELIRRYFEGLQKQRTN
ncbi:MAG TPA: DUF4175 family protein [Bacteroidota bacterium]|nr:DUF4175 family protein [Bacteroidota bacterium]